MSAIKAVLFDLDGTITDPGIGITNSVMHALKYYGFEEADRTKLYSFIGPPLAESFEHYCGISAEESYRAVDHYREYFSDKGIFENEVYDGVPAMLAALQVTGIPTALSTSKPEVYAKRILDHFGLSQYFACVTGSELDGRRVRKADVIRETLQRIGLEPSDDIMMVGDREHDIIGAHEAGLPAIGVLYGYGSREELEAAGAEHIAATPDELRALLLG